MKGPDIPGFRPECAALVLALLLLGACEERPLPDRPVPAAELLLTEPPPAVLEGPETHPRAPDRYRVRIEVADLGSFVLQVTRAWAPNAADRFHDLVKRGFFDQAPFYRVVPGFVVQFGRAAWPEANARWLNLPLADETEARPQPNRPGTITFAQREGPNTRTTEVFINLGDNSQPPRPGAPSLDQQGFLPFGEVVEGMEIVRAIYRAHGEMAPLRQDGGGVDPARLASEGLRYVLESFPMLDRIERATVE